MSCTFSFLFEKGPGKKTTRAQKGTNTKKYSGYKTCRRTKGTSVKGSVKKCKNIQTGERAYETGPWPKRLCAISPWTYRVLNLLPLLNIHSENVYTYIIHIYTTQQPVSSVAAAVILSQSWTLRRRRVSTWLYLIIHLPQLSYVQYIIHASGR